MTPLGKRIAAWSLVWVLCGVCGTAVTPAQTACSRCGAEAAPGQKFCGTCGAPIA